MSRSALPFRMVVALLVCATVTGCTSGGDEDAPGAAATGTATSEPAGAAPGAGTPSPSAPPAGGAPAGPAIGAVTIPIGFVPGGEVLAEVLDLEVVGDLLRMRMRFTAALPSGTDDVALGAVLVGNENQGGAPVEPELIDATNLKAYEVVTGGARVGQALRLVDDGPTTVAFYYAAPEDPVSAFDVVLSAQAGIVTDVPFGR